MTIVRSLKEEKGEQRGGRVGVRWQDWVAAGISSNNPTYSTENTEASFLPS